VPYWLNPEAGVAIVLKTAIEPMALAEPLKQAVKEIDPNLWLGRVLGAHDRPERTEDPLAEPATTPAPERDDEEPACGA